MHVRTIKPHAKYETRSVQIVQAFRGPNGPTHRLVRHLGTAKPGPALESLQRVAQIEVERLRSEINPSPFEPSVLADLAIIARRRHSQKTDFLPALYPRLIHQTHRLSLGFHEVLGGFFKRIGFPSLWNARHRRSAAVFFHEVLMGLIRPGQSKLSHSQSSEDDTGTAAPVQLFYRMMDRLDERRIRKIRKLSWDAAARLFDGPLQVLLFDTTSLSFESDRADDLRKNGCSKDGKGHHVQVVLALLMTEEGLPVGYHLYPGNTTDVTTVLPALQEIRAQHQVGKVVFVSEAGMMSMANLRALSKEGCDYVVAARLRMLSKELLSKVTELSRYSAAGKKGRRSLELQYRGRRLVVTYSPRRARKDEKERAKAVKKAQQQLQTGKVRARLRFVTSEGGARLDEEAIARDALFDGLHGIWTSEQETPQEKVRERYAELCEIENGFRVMKHDMRTRPVCDWTERRVRAHVALRYCGFVLLRHMQKELNGRSPKLRLSERRVMEELGKVQASVLRYGASKEYYLLPSAPSELQKKIYNKLGLILPRNCHEFPEYLGG